MLIAYVLCHVLCRDSQSTVLCHDSQSTVLCCDSQSTVLCRDSQGTVSWPQAEVMQSREG